MLCDTMESDHHSMIRLQQKYPKKLKAIRFEDLALNPREKALKMMEFLDIPHQPHHLDRYIATHTRGRISPGDNAPESTRRNSSQIPFKWATQISEKWLKTIEVECKNAMALWGYEHIYPRKSTRESLATNRSGLDTMWPISNNKITFA